MSSLENLLQGLDDFEAVRETYLRAPFGYTGGKTHSFERILKYLPYRNNFIETFGGSGVVILNRNQSNLDVFNDRYAGVVAFYRCIRDRAKMEQLVERLNLTIHSREEFVWCKNTWRDCQDDVERAARWYYMVKISFICKGQAYGRYLKGKFSYKIPQSLDQFPLIQKRFEKIQVENLDWRQCIKDFASVDTVFYHDPPYLGTDSGIYEHKFTEADHINFLDTIAVSPGYHAVSSYSNDLYNRYSWDNVYEWDVKVWADAQAITETNNRTDIKPERAQATEVLYIRDNS